MISQMNVAVHSHYRDQFARLEPQLAGANLPWLRNARREAFDRFAELGFPTTRHEDWKYTNVASIEKRAFMSPVSSNGVGAAQVNALGLAGAHRLIFVNGHYDAALSHVHSLPAGVTLRNLAKALVDDADRLERWPRDSMRSTERSGPMARTSTSRPVRRSPSRFTCCSSARKPMRGFKCER